MCTDFSQLRGGYIVYLDDFSIECPYCGRVWNWYVEGKITYDNIWMDVAENAQNHADECKYRTPKERRKHNKLSIGNEGYEEKEGYYIRDNPSHKGLKLQKTHKSGRKTEKPSSVFSKPDKSRNLLTKKEVAFRLKCHPESLGRMVRNGAIPDPIRLGDADNAPVRWVESEIDKFIEEQMSERKDLSDT